MWCVGLNVTRLSAVDGRALTEEQLRSQSTRLAVLLQPRGPTPLQPTLAYSSVA